MPSQTWVTAARAAIALPLILIVSACGSVFQQPQVSLESVRLGGLGLSGGTLLVDVEVINPNRFTLSADRLRYQLALREPGIEGDTVWLDFAAGTHAEPFSVGAGDTAIVRVPVEFSYAGLGSAANSILRNGTFTYRATGVVDVRTPIGAREVPFNKRGTVTLAGSP